jgi:mercuric ion binding protein
MDCPAILFTMKPFASRFFLIGVLSMLPFVLVAGTAQPITLDVQNMTCAVCPITVKRALVKVPGVTAANVDFAKKTATITFDPEKASPASLIKATSDAGYPSTVLN